MDTLWPTLVEFLLRLCFGLATAMLITPARWVTSGFFRVHLWVLMGLATLASLAIYARLGEHRFTAIALALAIAAAVASYVGAVVWMYEARKLGKLFLAIVAGLFAATGAAVLHLPSISAPAIGTAAADFTSGAMVLGLFMAAMLLGHWYLNNPGMKLEPLQRLVILCGVALAIRAALSLTGVAQLASLNLLPESTIGWSFLAFRWLVGIVGPAVMAWLTWETLKVPNTQSATGILYAAVTLTFLGELTAQLLTRGLPVPI